VTLAQRCRIVRVWTIQGELVSELRGHTDYVYEVCAGQNEAILSCGEDHSVVSGEAETMDRIAPMSNRLGGRQPAKRRHRISRVRRPSPNLDD
jgi:hypothetical protein